MSLLAIRRALEGAFEDIAPAIAIAYENHPFEPVAGVPYAALYLLPAEPDNIEMGPGYTERGLFQANLFYPKDNGAKAALDQAALIRTAFPFAASFDNGGVTVNIYGTPEIAPARTEGDRYLVPVRIRWRARIGG